MRTMRGWWIVGLTGCLALLAGCIGSPGSEQGDQARPSSEIRKFPLDTLPTATMSFSKPGSPQQPESTAIRIWLATTPEQQTEGLMHVPSTEIADDQGMLFVFDQEDYRYFWMKDTITALDIAYARADGTIVSTWQMPPLTLQSYPSLEPAMFALEMKAGSFARLGIEAGGRLFVPGSVFTPNP